MNRAAPTPPAHCTFDPEDWLRLARCWHPVARAEDIGAAPVKAVLLDEQLVIYRVKGQVVVARDVCPHRGVPLTLGFHDGEGIVCPYHGLRYGLIWTCLAFDAENPMPLPTLPHWDDEGFQQINCPGFEVNGFAGRQVEGFLDVAHFAWIHTDTFADPDNQLVPDYIPQETPFGFTADYWSSVGNYPASSEFRAPDGFQWLRHFELHLPFTATLTIHFPGEARLVIMNAASPVSSRVTRMFAPIARNFDLHVPVEEVHAFNLRVFEEDRLMVETQRPERLPLDLTLEAHIPADRSSIAYRRSLKKMGFGEFFLV